MKNARTALVLAGSVMLLASPVAAQPDTSLDAVASDPVAMGWMQGSPPPLDKRILFERGDDTRFPMTRYSFSNMRQFRPTTLVARGKSTPAPLPLALRGDLDAVTFTPHGGGAPMRWDYSLGVNFTDGILILHKGQIVYERYFGVATAETRHISWSVTKSFVGTLAEMMIAEGRLEPERRIESYLPELAGSGFGDATVRQVMDMTAGLDFTEDYTDTKGSLAAYRLASGLMPRPADYRGPGDGYAFLPTIAKAGVHGERFTYRSPITSVLGWLIARLEGKPLARVLSERLWQPLGMEADADALIDPAGALIASAGLSPTLRDMGRFGEAMRLGGRFNGQQVIPAGAVDSVRRGGSPDRFDKVRYPLLPGWSYRSQWWVTHNPHGAFTARGIHGQAIYIDPAAEMVIARFASHPTAANGVALDRTSLPAYEAIAAHLMRVAR